ncbi:hypothetical protein VMT65_01275 [Nocardia sp. CDC153]|uniref:hypothetical protein n=1 Tax=Nocardia sp. CDC153 TaxID=3112167 RepID=UPI002DBBB93E|nr:hypothetical protein [Nocardia sp. CDC153]MEC3951652.1 hypothetical protein [Nocardia sp. CDC153]
MSTEEERTHRESARQDERHVTPEPEVTDEHREKAHRMAESYRDDRPPTVLPGTDGMVTGTAVTDWVNDAEKRKGRSPEGERPSQ